MLNYNPVNPGDIIYRQKSDEHFLILKEISRVDYSPTEKRQKEYTYYFCTNLNTGTNVEINSIFVGTSGLDKLYKKVG